MRFGTEGVVANKTLCVKFIFTLTFFKKLMYPDMITEALKSG